MTSIPCIHLLPAAMLHFLVFCPPGSSGNEMAEKVDLIELNHFYDLEGKHQYDQIIFYEWSTEFRRFHVISWNLVEQELSRLPTRRPLQREYVVSWYDRDSRMEREVYSKIFRQTWSQVDPERANKKLIDEKYRVSLLRPNDCKVCQR